MGGVVCCWDAEWGWERWEVGAGERGEEEFEWSGHCGGWCWIVDVAWIFLGLRRNQKRLVREKVESDSTVEKNRRLCFDLGRKLVAVLMER